jgi:hypothetical protein
MVLVCSVDELERLLEVVASDLVADVFARLVTAGTNVRRAVQIYMIH